MNDSSDTISAIATPQGQGGIGIIRISGPQTKKIAQALLGCIPKPRHAHFAQFRDATHEILDEGLALFFEQPHSFTGEDVLELQGHGGPIILNRLLKAVVAAGARLAQPGEFSKRAFLNDKIDLAQAEAIADLISCQSEAAASAAMRSLQGAFSQAINRIVHQLIELRLYVEAAIDFPEEEIDFLGDGIILTRLHTLINDLKTLQQQAKQGSVLREGITVVITGAPNAGKSSLLNALSGQDSAIVTHIPGTTRDLLKEHILCDGMPVHLIDTAGLRESIDIVEQEGIRRAKAALKTAQGILLVVDASTHTTAHLLTELDNLQALVGQTIPIGLLLNKADLLDDPTCLNTEPLITGENTIPITLEDALSNTDKLSGMPSPRGAATAACTPLPHTRARGSGDRTVKCDGYITPLFISAKTHQGLDALRTYLKNLAGNQHSTEDSFLARHRHLEAIAEAQAATLRAEEQLVDFKAGELLAEELRQAQAALSSITGQFTSDDLLGKIFSSFCIGK